MRERTCVGTGGCSPAGRQARTRWKQQDARWAPRHLSRGGDRRAGGGRGENARGVWGAEKTRSTGAGAMSQMGWRSPPGLESGNRGSTTIGDRHNSEI